MVAILGAASGPASSSSSSRGCGYSGRKMGGAGRLLLLVASATLTARSLSFCRGAFAFCTASLPADGRRASEAASVRVAGAARRRPSALQRRAGPSDAELVAATKAGKLSGLFADDADSLPAKIGEDDGKWVLEAIYQFAGGDSKDPVISLGYLLLLSIPVLLLFVVISQVVDKLVYGKDTTIDLSGKSSEWYQLLTGKITPEEAYRRGVENDDLKLFSGSWEELRKQRADETYFGMKIKSPKPARTFEQQAREAAEKAEKMKAAKEVEGEKEAKEEAKAEEGKKKEEKKEEVTKEEVASSKDAKKA